MKAVDRTGIDMIDSDECLRLLRSRRVGRLGIVVGGEPLILPVNYAVTGATIVFRSAPGSKLDMGPRAPACFEVDEFDESMSAGWSVLIAGRLEEIDAGEVAGTAVTPWAPGERDHWMRLVPRRVTGRRVGPA
jgi:nitroimidazol reductase NimA-like FMN-containing flavoprotein (pyridoxamine 5'-phosphate oxidase superfamily)